MGSSNCYLRQCSIMLFLSPTLTLFMLVSALMGLDTMQAAYAHSIAQGYRFYSYGDSSLLLPQPAK